MSTSPWRSSSLLLQLLLVLLGGSTLLPAVTGDDGSTQQPPVLAAALNGSSSSHNSALDPVYYVKNLFIEQLYSNIEVSPIVDVTQGRGDYAIWPAIQLILAAMAPLAACVIIGILFCVIMPIAGLCCCCCRMCGKCGGKPPTMDPPRAKCKRVSCGFTLLALTTLMLGAAVVTFLSTDEIYKQLQTDEGSALSRYNPAMDALFDTVSETLQKPAEAVGKINQSFGGILDTSDGSIFSALSGVPLDFVPVTLAALNVSNGKMSSILADLDTLRNAQSNISHLNLSGCCVENSNCTVTYNANYSSFNTALLSSAAIANAIDALLKANGVYEKLREGIVMSIYSAKAETASTVKKLQDNLASFTSFDGAQAKNSSLLPPSVKTSIADYSKYVRIGGFALGAIVALVVLLLYLGLCCGLCGRRAGDDSSSCNKASGAKSLLAAVGFMFLFSWLLMLVTMILFPASSIHIGCLLVNGSLNSKFEVVKELQDTSVDLGLKGVNITVGKMESTFRDCSENSLLSVVEAYVPEASQIVTNLTNKNNWNVDELRRKIGSVSVQLPSDIQSTISTLTSVISSLRDLRNGVDRLQALVVQEPFFPDPSVVLTNISSNRNECVTVKAQFEEQSSAAVASWTRLQQLTGIQQLLGNVTQSIEDAHTGMVWLQGNVSGGAVTLPTQVFDGILSNLTTVINQTAQQLMAYPCSPLYTAAKNVADLFCSAILDPVDALWFSLGWATALFLPLIIIALCLVSLYRREEPYKSRKDGRNYQGYEDEGVTIRDNVPLDNMPPRKSHYPYNESYLNAAYSGPQDDGRGDGSMPPPYYGMYTGGGGGGGGASNGGHFPRVVHSPTNGDVTFGGPGPSVPMSQKRY